MNEQVITILLYIHYGINYNHMIEALHEFHNEGFAKGWADKFEPTPDRLDLFETILLGIEQLGKSDTHVLELGIGPGYLADFLLSAKDSITYQGFDFSAPMLEIAENRLKAHLSRVSFSQVDLLTTWSELGIQQPQIIVSTWSLHDLMSEENIQHAYQEAFKLLPIGGVILNGDFIKPENVTQSYEKGRLLEKSHLKMLSEIGFKNIRCLKQFEVNKESPTTANNYSCFFGEKLT